jgi:glycosyltransferase involved in cell wall biosynthesis
MWYDLKLPAILKKYRADLFISFDGFCSMTTGIPQFIVFNDSFLLNDAAVLSRPRSIFYNRFMQKSLQKAKTIICISDFRKQDLRLRYLVDADKIDVIYPAVNEPFQALNEDVKEKVRMKYCDGKNYFVFTGTMEKRQDLINLLKGFSAFKKRQKSNWKLLLISYPHQYERNFIESLANYKYRSDVVVAKNVNEVERAGLIGSAYAVICAAHSEMMVFPILQALKCEVPLITTNCPAGREVAGDAALYYDHADSESIAGQMMNIYKDESFRSMLIEKGKEKVMKYSFDKSAKLFWEFISGTKVDFKSHGVD